MQSIGKTIETKLREKGMSVSEFARRINTNRNNVYNIFQRESIDTALLKKISKVLEFDFFTCFNKSSATVAHEPEQLHQNELKSLKNKINILEKEIVYLKKLLSDKDKIIELLEKSAAKKKKQNTAK